MHSVPLACRVIFRWLLTGNLPVPMHHEQRGRRMQMEAEQ